MEHVFKVVTFGSPDVALKSYYKSERAAVVAAQRAKGTGACTAARVVRCTRVEARSADISGALAVVFTA
jgi:hypothetical protein